MGVFSLLCVWIVRCSFSNNKSIVSDVSTLRRHLEALHSVSLLLIPLSYLNSLQRKYRKWAQKSNFESKLPGDVQKRKAAAEIVTRTLDRDLREKKVTERVVPYSDKSFHQAAIEWLVATDQVRPRIMFSMCSFNFSIANTSPRTPEVQRHDRPCLTCQGWCKNTRPKVNASRDRTDVQGPSYEVEGTTQCRHIPSLLFPPPHFL